MHTLSCRNFSKPSRELRSPRQRSTRQGELRSGRFSTTSNDISSLAMYLGLDFGTSGARATVIDDDGTVVTDIKKMYSSSTSQDGSHLAKEWESVLFSLLNDIPAPVRADVSSIAIDGTSATAMLVDRESGVVLAPPKLYNEAQSPDIVDMAKAMAPPAHTATASTSTLCKLLTWHTNGVWQEAEEAGHKPGMLHQADWLASLLHGQRSSSDWNNALKVGYDPETTSYPDWLLSQEFAKLLPSNVVAPGIPVAPVLPSASVLAGGLAQACIVCGGTTDSIAAFVAADVSRPGQAVTSLGSTLAVKLLSTTRVDDAAYGVYSHRLGDAWLVGGASNTGGAVLRQNFTDEQLDHMTPALDPSSPTGLDYYPLVTAGERFPINDPNLEPRLTPRPTDDTQFFQGILEGVSQIEADAYALLHRLGASKVVEVYTAGGGAANEKWTAMRAQRIGVPVVPSTHGDASYGAALLARQGARQYRGPAP